MQRALRAVALLFCFAVTASLVAAGSISWLRDARLGRPTLVFDYARMMGKRLPALADAGRDGRRTVGFLGDSGVVSYPAGGTVPERLQQAIDASDASGPGASGVHVASLGMSGSGPFDYYCLADRIAEARPSLVVVSVNLDHFSDSWRGAYSRPQLAGLIEPGRLAEAVALPFHWIGLTTDRLLFYVSIVQSGSYEPWYWLSLRQTQVGRARERFERWLQGAGEDTPEDRFEGAVDQSTIARLFTGPDIRHYEREGLLHHYAPTLAGLDADHPVLSALAGTVRGLRDSGSEVLVYTAPVEVSWLDAQGVLGDDGFAATVATLHDVVVANGGSFVDLHDRLPAEAFRDAPGHLAHPPEGIDGPALLADLLRAPVLDALTGRRDSDGPSRR
jgi:hypothetical protein